MRLPRVVRFAVAILLTAGGALATNTRADDSALLSLLDDVRAERWEDAAPRLRAAADTVSDGWIAEIHAGLAYAALAKSDPDSAWYYLETGRLRFLEARGGFAPEPTSSPISLEETKLLLSGSHATLLAYGDSHRLPPLCFVVHPEGEHVFAIESERVRTEIARMSAQRAVLLAGDEGATSGTDGPPAIPERALRSQADVTSVLRDLVGPPWTRLPSTTERLFLQPPVALWDLPFEATSLASIDGDDTAPIGQLYPISFLPWSTVLSWASSPRTRSGDGLVILGEEEDANLWEILGGRPRRAPLPGTSAGYAEWAPRADVLFLIGRAPEGTAEGPGLRLDDGILPCEEIPAHHLQADAVLLDPRRTAGNGGWIASALLGSGARAIFTIDASLPDSISREAQRELFLRLRTGTPRDRAVSEILLSFGERGRPLPPEALRVWGPGHLPVYALMAKRGLGSLLLSWAIFLGSGFFLLRFFIRRFVRADETATS